MKPAHAIVCLAGHIDHGKTALIRALTGTQLDRRREEQKRGITIDLGFTHWTLPAQREAESPWSLGIIDVPGHADFVKNMISGTGAVDLCLLVVAADDGWMPQTEEHFQIAEYLRIPELVVAVTKADLDRSLTELVVESVKDELADTRFAQAPVVPVSALTGDGIEALSAAVRERLAHLPEPPEGKLPRLFVDRVFSPPGIGTVVTGTLHGGALTMPQPLYGHPRPGPFRLRSLQQHGNEVPEALPRTRAALNLGSTETLARGQVLETRPLGDPSRTIDVLLERSPRALDTAAGRPLKHDSRIHLHWGGTHHPAKLLLPTASLEGGAQSLARLHLEKALPLRVGDRFIVRDWQNANTIAGGVTLDPTPPARSSLRRRRQSTFLQRCAAFPDSPQVHLAALLARDGWITRPQLAERLALTPEALAPIVEQSRDQGVVWIAGDNLFDTETWRQLLGQLRDWVNAQHSTAPALPGIPLADLRERWKAAIPTPGLPLAPLLDALAVEGLQTVETFFGATSHRPHLLSAEETIAQSLRAALAEAAPGALAWNPADAATAEVGVIDFLRRSGEIVLLGDVGLLRRTDFTAKQQVVTAFLRQQKSATASELRSVTGLSRKHAIPFLEALDAAHITQRIGESRILRSPSG